MMTRALRVAVVLLPLAAAELTFDSIFHGGAVLQRRSAVTVRGGCSGDQETSLRLALDGKPLANATVKIDSERGRWSALLPPQEAGWHRQLSASDGTETASVIVSWGEVLLCSGQSNMQMPVAHWAPCCDNASYVGQCSCFSADNGTAAAAAAGRYTGKISLATVETPFPKPASFNGSNCRYPWTNASCVSQPTWNAALPGPTGTVHGFSALCWYLLCSISPRNVFVETSEMAGFCFIVCFRLFLSPVLTLIGRSRYTAVALFEKMQGEVAVGAIVGSIGGSPIEFWLPPGHVNNSLCGVDTPACDDGGKNKYTDSDFFSRLIKPFMPYTLGTVLWDQAERDVHCLPAMHGLLPENTTARYACLERQLLASWRDGFNEKTTRPFLFIAVQVITSAVAIASRLIIIY